MISTYYYLIYYLYLNLQYKIFLSHKKTYKIFS